MTPWVLLLLTFVLGIGAALNAPAWQASLPELVPRDELTAAIALNGIQFNLARAIGPALGGVLIAAIGVGSAFLINAASFLGVVLLLFFWRREPTKSTLPAERLVGAIKAGFVIRDTLARLLLFWFGPEHLSSVPVQCPRCSPYMLGMSSALALQAMACCLASSAPAASFAVC
jgi:MFS family permease